MPEIAVALRESIEEVLERMFFIQCLGESPEPPAGPEVSARVAFEGEPSGNLLLRITAARAQAAAADFLGLDATEISEREVGDVICEMANMVCGSVLSRMEAAHSFRLAAPEIVSGEEDHRTFSGANCALEVEEGRIAVTMTTETPGWG